MEPGKTNNYDDKQRTAEHVACAVDTNPWWAIAIAILGAALSLVAIHEAGIWSNVSSTVAANAAVTGLFTLALGIKSILDFSQTGPEIRDEVLRHYRLYTLLSFLRLCFWAFVLLFLIGGAGILIYSMLALSVGIDHTQIGVVLAALLGITSVTVLAFLRQLLLLPSSLCASLNYRPSRLNSLWKRLSPGRILAVQIAAGCLVSLLLLLSTWKLLQQGDVASIVAILGGLSLYCGLICWAIWESPARVVASKPSDAPNILMIGSDTLRSDRISASYFRQLSPAIDRLAADGVQFSGCFVPCARTAPSLVSLLTGSWPHNHGIRDNFVADHETSLPRRSLPEVLKEHGYLTGAISDWCGADLKKFSFGFDILDLPEDQWNIKYLLRQGPKDMRLFLSLFTHNRFGKTFLPEIYYLAGVPLTRQTGLAARRALSAFADRGQPFLLNVFSAATHPPFGSDFPYYTLFSDPDYQGESKFVMARLTDPFEIIRRQGEAKAEFDLDQIINLYDGCVKSFDDEVGKILSHMDACGLGDNTIVVIYSDHGMEFFEHETWGQGNSAIGDFSPRVPLIISNPQQQGSGRVVDHVVRSIDLAPTLLDLLGIQIPQSMDGVSLTPYLKGETTDLGLVAYNETGIWITDLPGMPEGHLSYPNLLEMLEVPDKRSGTLSVKKEFYSKIIQAKDRMVRRDRWKLVYQPLEDRALFMLFDVVADPQCRNNLLEQHPGIVTELRTLLAALVEPDGILATDLEIIRPNS